MSAYQEATDRAIANDTFNFLLVKITEIAASKILFQKMNAKLLALIVIYITNFRVCQSKKYDNYMLFTVTPIDVDHLKFLQNLEKQKYIDMVFWKKPCKLYHDVQFIVNPADRDLFIERAKHFKMRYDITVPDIQK